MVWYTRFLKLGKRSAAGAGKAQVVGAEVFDPDLLGRLLDHRPDRPVAQRVAIDLAAFGNRSQEPAIFDAGRGHPSVDALLHPDRDGDGADATAFAFKFSQYPTPLSLCCAAADPLRSRPQTSRR